MTFWTRRSLKMASRSAALVFGMMLVVMANPARAGWFTSYDVTLDRGFSDVTQVLMLERDQFGGSITWAFTAIGDLSGPNTTTLNNPFNHDRRPDEALLMGLTTNLPGDGSAAQEHVVLMMDNTAADLSRNIAWGTLFRNTLEADLIDAIKLATSGQDFDVIDPGLDFLYNFAATDGVTGILAPGGAPRSAWFAMDDTFSVMAFSDGTQIGTGTSLATFVADPQATAVPEPSTAVAGLIGLGFGIFCLKRSAITVDR